ncbi:Amino-acid carrier protein AlsT [Zhongshania aliphaticivorans]|uniref:Amino-acid carrier protein AlsT n=1 Tax=Zhongshania aliphaticivorans TaxID=1470434 RepID=A0A5S9NEN9_9GAMM|nr:sodium:alanine symporter family protein [Zhongshania aliphaticivorans]CAA0088652.1 Amino-acid carrier protein AlsT [Zhongshania aliphaticivorans]CAA0094848.1 Amino-acid carrier protein AlsT [Zhongshania aliphaticivorans]
MEQVSALVSTINGIVWGPLMLVLILGTGAYLMLGLKLMPLRNIGAAFRLLINGRKGDGNQGEISPFQALMTSLSATIGTGNIAGVATAIALGGPGALFWMWCTALVGMATKYAEAVCAVHFREQDAEGNFSGGPMYYIKNGLGSRWQWLGACFAVFGAMAGFGIGNTVQANSVADAMQGAFGVPVWLSAVVMFVGVAAVILGGVKRIASVAGFLVPFMAISYLIVGLVILLMNIPLLPAVFSLVIDSAFNGTAAVGGFAGAGVAAAIRFGVARGVFSNEAGLGSAPIAHAAAKTNNPVRQGMIAMLGTFIDTILVCTVTGFVILLSGVWETGESGAALSTLAFESQVPGGHFIVAIGLAVFAFTTMLGWSYYSERCVVYFFGSRGVMPFRIAWVLAIPMGAMANLGFIWLLADTLNALMAIPNLIALLLLSPVVFKLTQQKLAEAKEGV